MTSPKQLESLKQLVHRKSCRCRSHSDSGAGQSFDCQSKTKAADPEDGSALSLEAANRTRACKGTHSDFNTFRTRACGIKQAQAKSPLFS